MVTQETYVCQICKETKKQHEVVPAASIHESIGEVIRKEYPSWSREGYICHADLNRFRAHYVREILEKEKDELSTLEEKIAQSMKNMNIRQKISISNLTAS